MKTISSVEILGFAGRDAEKRSDKAPVKFRVATGNDKKPGGGGKTPLCFHNVTVWDRQSEALKIRKGDYIRVAGRLNYTEWTGQDGAKRSGVEIVADRVEILPRIACLRASPSRSQSPHARSRKRRCIARATRALHPGPECAGLSQS